MKDKLYINGRIRLGNDIKRGTIFADSKTGLIEAVIFDETAPSESFDIYNYNEDYIIEPGDFNAHSHPEQSLYTDMTDKSWDLGTWCRNTIYKYSPILQPEHIYYGCCRAFSRMLSYGVTSVMVSFYCHNNNGNLYDQEVIRAAENTGIRLYFGRMNYDIITEDAYEAKKNSQKGYFETPKEAEENFEALLATTHNERIVIAPAIHSIHASTRDAIIKAINLGNKHGRMVQFHLSEDQGDVSLSEQWYAMKPVKFLESLLKSGEVQSLEKLFLSDCIWIDDEERELIKKHDMKVVLNPRMNNQIKAGKADLEKILALGMTPWLGTDGEASNDDLSIEGERQYLMKQYPSLAPHVISQLGRQPFDFGSGSVGTIEKGGYCDLKITKSGEVVDVFVGGEPVVRSSIFTRMEMENEIEKPLKNITANL